MASHHVVWAAVFDAGAARVYHVDRAARRLHSLDVAPAQRKSVVEHRDAPMRTYQSVGERRGFGDDPDDSKRAIERAYISEIANALAARVRAHDVHDLLIVAPPRALGVFREVAPADLVAHVRAELPADHVKTDPRMLYDFIDDALSFPRS